MLVGFHSHRVAGFLLHACGSSKAANPSSTPLGRPSVHLEVGGLMGSMCLLEANNIGFRGEGGEGGDGGH